ncbi:efflux RND transporter periplasmic adaptor subunit [Cohnella hongkongensis]|uniref:Efflux RND transporter periplasmic adaptor subunit n=1 Tax=Cohnella hongkongensis TaxID=178337 RepID=A0ABV9F7F4_9BACL
MGWTVSVAVIAAGAWGGYRYFDGKEEPPLASAMATAPVRKGTIEVKVGGTGQIQPADRQTVTAGKGGTVRKVHVKKGDTVKKGDLLVTYEEEDVSGQLRSKEIELKKKKLELQDLQTKFKSAPDDESREEVALSIQKQELDIESVQADIASLQTDKGVDPIVAPIDGMLTSFEVKEGDSLNPNSTVGEIVDYAQLQMVVGIDELDIPKVELEQEAAILVEALPDQSFAGKVVAIADEGTSSNGVASFDVTIALSEAANLKVGMSAEASILTAQKTDALYVPVEAVQSSQGKYFVLVPATAAEAPSAAPSAEAEASQSGAERQTGEAGQERSRNGQAPAGASGELSPRGAAPGEGMPGNLSEEERAAMRERLASGQGPDGTAAGATQTARVEVAVGVNNEDRIEIVSGLKEGDLVVLPTATAASASRTNMQSGFPGLGAGGGIPGAGGAGFSGGGGMAGGRPGAGGGR